MMHHGIHDGTSLPEGVLDAIVQTGSLRHVYGVIACVCKAWRDAVNNSSRKLAVNIMCDAAAAALTAWLQHHSQRLQELDLAAVGVYGRYCDDATQLQLFQALHAAAANNPEANFQPLIVQHSAALSRQQEQQQLHIQLKCLSVQMRVTPADCAAIAALPAPHFVKLRLIGSRTRRLGLGIKPLTSLQHLTSLQVQQLGIGDEAAILLARNLTGLLQLSLSGNNITNYGVAGLSRHLTNLQHLDLSVNRMKDPGLVALCNTLHNLQHLSISCNLGFSVAGLHQLHQLSKLRYLCISSSGIAAAGLAAITAALPQLLAFDAANNKISKADALTGLVCLTSLTLSRNPLQLNCGKILAGLSSLKDLVLFDAISAKAIPPVAQLAVSLTSFIGRDPSLNPEGTQNLPLTKSRISNALFGAFAGAGQLQVLAVPCTGLADAQAKVLGSITSLTALNISYNSLSPDGLRFVRDLPQVRRLEVKSMRPELTDNAAKVLSNCRSLQLLDIAYNDLSSEGIRLLGSGQLLQLQHLNLRNNVQVEKWGILAAAPQLSTLTYLNLMELSDVSARGGIMAGSKSASRGAAAGGGAWGGSSSGRVSGSGLHADLWSAYPNLEELVVGTYNSSSMRTGKIISHGG